MRSEHRYSCITNETHSLEALEPRVLLSATVEIATIGDSIFSGNAEHNSFRRPLWHMLQNAGYDVDFVGSLSENKNGPAPDLDFDPDHEGHSGWRANDILRGHPNFPEEGKLDEWLQDYTPDLAMVHIGTNDLIRLESVQNVLVETGNIIRKLRNDNPDVIIFLAQLIPGRHSNNPDLPADIVELNAALPGLVANMTTAASPIHLVDQHTGYLIDVDNYDSLHPAESGELKLAQNFFAAMAPILDVFTAPTGTIAGTVYNDLNNNGDQDGGETGLANQTVYLDANDNNTLDTGETQTQTDANGDYSFDDIDALETYTVRVAPAAGNTITEPAGDNEYVIPLAKGEVSADNDFGIYQGPGSIAGTVYEDLNNNGDQDGGEAGMAGRTVYLDANGNNALDTGETQTLTSASGEYSFDNLAPNATYTVRVVPPADYVVTEPAGGENEYDIAVTPGLDSADNDFGLHLPLAEISGEVYFDLNDNGNRDGGEPGMAGWLVYLDANGNNNPDAGETQMLTDTNGDYRFDGLLPNQTYTVRVDPPEGFVATEPVGEEYELPLAPGQVASNRDFGFYLPTVDTHGDTPQTASQIGALGGELSIAGHIGAKDDPADMFKFSLKKRSDVKIDLDNLLGNADVRIYDKKGKKLLHQSVNNGAADEALMFNLKRGGYVVEIYKRPGESDSLTTYSLNIIGGLTNEIAQAAMHNTNTETVPPLTSDVQQFNDMLDGNTLINSYKTKFKGKRTMQVALSNVAGNVTVKVCAKRDKVVAETFSSGENILLNVPGGKRGGNYTVKIINNAPVSTYTLDLSAPAPIETIKQKLSDTVVQFDGKLDPININDVYQTTFGRNRVLQVAVTNIVGDVTVQITSKGGTVLDLASSTGDDIALSQLGGKRGGKYTVKIINNTANSTYTLGLSAPNVV